MKRTLMIFALSLAIAVAASARGGQQKPATDSKPLPTADQILDKYVQAIGGKSAIEKQTSRVSKGSFEIPAVGATGTAEIYEKAPDKNAATITIAGFGVVQEGYDGKTAWAQDPQSGLREKSGLEFVAAKLDGDFYKPIKLKQLYPKMAVKGKDKVGDKEVYVVEATPTEGSTETWYFDAQSGLLLRQDLERDGPQGKQAIQAFLEDYKEVNGMKIPFSIRQVTPQFTLTIKIEDIKTNVPIDDAKFKKPAA